MRVKAWQPTAQVVKSGFIIDWKKGRAPLIKTRPLTKMITQFSYTQLSDVNGWIKRIRDIGLKIFMKKRYDEVMDEVAKDVGLQQRTQRVFSIGEKFVGAMSYDDVNGS